MITQQSDSPNNNNRTMNPLSQMFQNIFSDNSNIMLAAIISLLLVILFVLLLHLYAKWFLAQAQAQAHARRRQRRLRRATVTVSDVLGPARFHHFHSFNIEDSPISSINTKGLDSAIIAAIPIFIYAASKSVKGDDDNDVYDEKQNKVELEHELECVICLSAFEDGDMGRCLPKCGHGFHVECIDMWLNTHSSCPICRAPIVVGGIVEVIESNDSQLGSVDGLDHHDLDLDHVHVHGDDATALVEIVIDDNVTPTSSEIRENDQSGNENGVMSGDSVSETSSSFMVGCSLKGMLSKVFPSSNVNELQA